MKLVKTVAGMQRLAEQWQQQGTLAGFVPTMGYLHAGHLSLVARARKAVGARGKVVMSIYVNPAQFGPEEDFSRYPRDLKRDLKLCDRVGVDVVFAPSDEEMYPSGRAGEFSTYVVEESLSQGMEGASRPAHFRGVTTIVAKLFNIVQPDVAVFGAKDYQQAAVIQRMVRDLNFTVRIVVAPTWREPDGLAMSSRNKYLLGDLRKKALVLRHAIKAVKARVAGSHVPIAAKQAKQEVRRIFSRESAARLDYAEFFDPVTLKPQQKVRKGVHMALAAYVGKTRLIDNERL